MRFNEQNHSYYKGVVKYTGVNELINKYKKPFQKEFIADKVAKKERVSQDKIIEKWNLNAQISINFGNAIDETIRYLLDFKEKPKHPFLKLIADDFENKFGTNIYANVNLYSDELLLAGTADLIIPLGNKEVDIWDVKTNGEINKKGYGYFLPPFSDLKQDKINEYRFQLSLYKLLAEKQGLKVRNLELKLYTNEFETIKLEPLDVGKIWKKSL